MARALRFLWMNWISAKFAELLEPVESFDSLRRVRASGYGPAPVVVTGRLPTAHPARTPSGVVLPPGTCNLCGN